MENKYKLLNPISLESLVKDSACREGLLFFANYPLGSIHACHLDEFIKDCNKEDTSFLHWLLTHKYITIREEKVPHFQYAYKRRGSKRWCLSVEVYELAQDFRQERDYLGEEYLVSRVAVTKVMKERKL